ncbi:MAG: PLP-dependent aminotransferase family protein, partial [Parvibaculaceae bacterium]
RTPRHIPVQVKIDLSMNLPPQPVEANLDLRIAQTVQAIHKELSFSAFLNYQSPGGSAAERETAARWLSARVPQADVRRLLIYPGNQAILFNALLSLTSPGDVVLTEALTFPGVKAVAEQLRLRLVGVAMDKDGIRPDAFKAACKQHKPKALYLVPTLHNPTTATLGPERRRVIAETIRAQGLVLIEDDAYGCLEPAVSPIANLIPERTYLAVGLSKCIAPALRISFLLAPDEAAMQRMTSSLQATTLMTPPLMMALVAHWLKSGVADKIIHAIRSEANGRQQLARRILKGFPYAARPNGHHLWLPLPAVWTRAQFLSRVLQHGLAVVGDDAFAVDDSPTPAVRVSLGAARNRAELAQALQCLADLLRSSVRSGQIV